MKSQRPARGKAPSRVPSSRLRASSGLANKFDVRTLTLAGLVVLAMLVLGPQIQTLITTEQRIADMSAKLEQAKQTVKDMTIERQRWDDPVYIRAQARDRLYYVMPGEVSYLVMDANGIDQSNTSGTIGAMIAARNNNAQISATVRTTKNNWAGALVESIVRSGLDEPVAAKAAN